MGIAKRITSGLVAGSLVLAMAGCQTYGEGAGLGATLGGATGAIIGHQSGRGLEGAVIGAALGGLVGLVAHDIKVQRAKSRAETVETYNYTPAQGEVLTLEETFVVPEVAVPGSQITASLQYAIIGTGDGTQVTETRQLLQGDKVIGELSSKRFKRQDGTWLTTQDFVLPRNLKPGEYSIVQRVRTDQQSIFGTSTFRVR